MTEDLNQRQRLKEFAGQYQNWESMQETETVKTVAKAEAEEGHKERTTNKIVVACAFVWLIIGVFVLIRGVASISYFNVIGSVTDYLIDDFERDDKIAEKYPETYARVTKGFTSLRRKSETPPQTINGENDPAKKLAALLVGREFCSLRYDQAAIRRYSTEHADGDINNFVSDTTLALNFHIRLFSELGESAKAARCTQIERLAQDYGFIN